MSAIGTILENKFLVVLLLATTETQMLPVYDDGHVNMSEAVECGI